MSFTLELFYKIHTTKFDSISSEIIEESYDETTVFDLWIELNLNFMKLQGNIKRSSETAQSLVLQAKKEN
jgi:replicative DNA helicase